MTKFHVALRGLIASAVIAALLAASAWGQLRAAAAPEPPGTLQIQPLHTLSGHRGAVTGVGITPDGKTVVSAGVDGSVRLWSADTGQLSATLLGHTKPINSLAVSPDGRWAASGGEDRTLRVWDLRTAKLARTLAHEDIGAVRSVAFSPDSKTVASADYEPTVRLWDLASGELRRTLFEPSNGMWSVQFAPDGKSVWSASAGGWVTEWDPSTGEAKRKLEGPGGNYQRLALSPDGSLLATGKGVWSTRTGERVHGDGATCFSPDGRWAASIGEALALRNVRTWSVEARLPHEAGGCASFSADSRLLVTANRAGEVKLWRVRESADG